MSGALLKHQPEHHGRSNRNDQCVALSVYAHEAATDKESTEVSTTYNLFD